MESGDKPDGASQTGGGGSAAADPSSPQVTGQDRMVTDTKTVYTHQFPVICVAALDNGRIASTDSLFEVHVWTPKGLEPKLEYSLIGHKAGITAIACVGDDMVATASMDRRVRIFDLSDAAQVTDTTGYSYTPIYVTNNEAKEVTPCQTLKGHLARVSCLLFVDKFEQDERKALLISGSHDYTLKVWSRQHFDLLFTFERHEDRIATVTGLGDGKLLSSSLDNVCYIWDPLNENVFRKLNGFKYTMTNLEHVGFNLVTCTSRGGLIYNQDSSIF